MTRPKLKVVPPDDETGPPPVASLFQSGTSVRPVKPNWLLPGRVVGNGLWVLEGDPESGKSTFLSAVAAAVTTGRPFLGRPKTKPADVLWFAGEEDPGSSIIPRLLIAGANVDRVHFRQVDEHNVPVPFALPGHYGVLRDAVEMFGARLVIMDPMSTFLAAACDLNSEGDVRAVLDPLNALGMSLSMTVNLTRHLRKDRSGPRINHGIGSVAIGATARSVSVIDWPDDKCQRRVLRVVKTSGGVRAPAVEYAHSFERGAPCMVGIRELSRADDDEASVTLTPGERDVKQDARTLLRALLASAWVKCSAVLAEAAAAAIGERTLRDAKTELGCQSRRVGTSTPPCWEWGPPKGGWR